jgi:hypothetical protein
MPSQETPSTSRLPATRQELNDFINSKVTRVVTGLAVPISAAVAAGLFWLQNAIGIDMQHYKAVAVGFVTSIILGGALLAAKWLEGRAGFEQTLLRVFALVDASAVPPSSPTVPVADSGITPEVPTVPPGISRKR